MYHVHVHACIYSVALPAPQLYESEMAAMMRREHERAEEVERRKEEERWEQSLHYQDQLERQLMEQVGPEPCWASLGLKPMLG